jgi:ribosomal protein S18 acetylase RimI-like enzyme
MKAKNAHRLRFAAVTDLSVVLDLMREYYAHDHLKFDDRAAEKALKHLLEDESLGRVWLIYESNRPVGYFVVTFGYSLEFHGKAAFLDEIHIRASHRGMGTGKRALAYVHDYCAAQGIKALRLEVEHENTQAHKLYTKAGFKDHTRHLMTKWLDDSR